MQSQQTFIQKTFDMTDELSDQVRSYSINVPYLPTTRQINISTAISAIYSAGLQIHGCHIFYMDFMKKMYVHIGQFPFKQEVYLKYQLFLDSAIKIRYRRVGNNAPIGQGSQLTAGNAPVSSMRRKNVKERTIKEASECVKKWRSLYQMIDNQGRRVHTLETAAKEVGLAKKTLDDYYYQLRQAESFNFDFQGHRQDKIGVLRTFVRKCIKRQILGGNVMTSQKDKEWMDDIDKYLASSDSDEDKR